MSQELALTEEFVMSKILFIRNQKVMIDSDLAGLYGVETKQLKRQVRRNIERFPDDFMFELNKTETEILRSQFGTLKQGEHSKYGSMAFTEQGVAMLSSVLNSETAIKVNIQIIRAFTKIRSVIADTTTMRLDIEELKSKMIQQGKNIELVFSYLDELIDKQENITRTKIGYK
jgi:phage regulator Rha-like protein